MVSLQLRQLLVALRELRREESSITAADVGGPSRRSTWRSIGTSSRSTRTWRGPSSSKVAARICSGSPTRGRRGAMITPSDLSGLGGQDPAAALSVTSAGATCTGTVGSATSDAVGAGPTEPSSEVLPPPVSDTAAATSVLSPDSSGAAFFDPHPQTIKASNAPLRSAVKRCRCPATLCGYRFSASTARCLLFPARSATLKMMRSLNHGTVYAVSRSRIPVHHAHPHRR